MKKEIEAKLQQLCNSQGQLYLYLHDEGEIELLAPSLEALLQTSLP